MKKILLSITAVMSLTALTAQVDTLTEFFTGTPTVYGVGAADGGGYVGGNNGYGDLTKMQLFDGTHGVTSGGTITNLLLWAPVIDGTGTFKAAIWANTAGAPGAELGSATITLTTVDTTIATGYSVAEGAVLYNVSATFSPAIAIPASGSFWAGVVLPTVTGDTLALVTNTDGDFADALTHTGENWSDDSFHTFGDAANWGLDVALAIFPVVDFVVGISENTITASVYPNPATDVLNIKLNANATSVSVLGMDGKVISTESVNTNTLAVNVADLVAGVYVYEIVAENGEVVRNTFVKK